MLAFQVPAFLLMPLNASGMPAFFDIGVGIMPTFRKPQMPAKCQHYPGILKMSAFSLAFLVGIMLGGLYGIYSHLDAA